MALITGKMSGRRFRATFSLDKGWREEIRDGFEKHAFVEKKITSSNRENMGLCRIEDLYSADFSDMSAWLVDDYVFFGVRFDKKVLDKKRLRRDLDEACRIWLEGRGVERVPGAVKKKLKQDLEDAAYDKAPLKSRIVEVCWNIKDEWFLIGSTSDNDCDLVRKLLKRAFGMPIVHATPGLQEIVTSKDGPSDISLDATNGFLDYLVYQLVSGKKEEGSFISAEGMTLFCDGNVVFVSPGDHKEKVVVALSTGLFSREALQAMAERKRVDKISLQLVRGKEDPEIWKFTVESDPSVMRGLAIPYIIESDSRAQEMRGRFDRYVEVFGVLTEIGTAWREEVGSGTSNSLDSIQKKLVRFAKKQLLKAPEASSEED